MWTLPRACAWACAWVCSLRRRGERSHVDFAEGLRVGMFAEFSLTTFVVNIFGEHCQCVFLCPLFFCLFVMCSIFSICL
jgi:hypothetical protein